MSHAWFSETDMSDVLHIIIPTFNNPQYLDPCVYSILRTGILNEKARLFIVNNGSQPLKEKYAGVTGIEVLDTGKNLGWEGGLAHALEKSDAPHVCFQNDDTFIPTSDSKVYHRMLTYLGNPTIGAVGPTTTTASGLQSVYHPDSPLHPLEVNWLIFFMVMLRRSDVDAAGGVDTTLPGGDDFDLSIRLKKLGKKLIIDPGSFLIHHGFKTGERVHGNGYAGVKGGWNSPEMIERTQHALIRKHGFKTFVSHYYHQKLEVFAPFVAPRDIEGDIVRSYISDGEKVAELGCGGQKSVPHAIGIDRVPRGHLIPNLPSVRSVADICASVEEVLPIDDFSYDTVIARHILEHCIDPIQTLSRWNRVIKDRGRLIIAVPDEHVTSGIPLNSEHCHAFTRESLRNLASACGFVEVGSQSAMNGISFVSCFEKVAHVCEEAVLA